MQANAMIRETHTCSFSWLAAIWELSHYYPVVYCCWDQMRRWTLIYKYLFCSSYGKWVEWGRIEEVGIQINRNWRGQTFSKPIASFSVQIKNRTVYITFGHLLNDTCLRLLPVCAHAIRIFFCLVEGNVRHFYSRFRTPVRHVYFRHLMHFLSMLPPVPISTHALMQLK